jgi:hypothetical protein
MLAGLNPETQQIGNAILTFCFSQDNANAILPWMGQWTDDILLVIRDADNAALQQLDDIKFNKTRTQLGKLLRTLS